MMLLGFNWLSMIVGICQVSSCLMSKLVQIKRLRFLKKVRKDVCLAL
jgi:hypothetical protein